MLLIGGSLLVRSFVRLLRADAGYDPANVLTAIFHLADAHRGSGENDQFLDALVERLRAIPQSLPPAGGACRLDTTRPP